MLEFKVALPIGHPSATLTDAQRTAAVQNVASKLRGVTGTPFGPTSTRLRFRFHTPESFLVNALWAGELTPASGSMATIELPPALTRHMTALLDYGLPTPRHVVFGPLSLVDTVLDKWSSGGGSTTVLPGDDVGVLTGDTLELGFLDAAGLAIDPTWVLRLFDSLGVWALPDPSRNPLLAPAAMPASVSVATPAATSVPAMTLRGSAGKVRFMRPPASVQAGLFPFLASDTLAVGLIGAPAGTRWRIVVQDVAAGTAPFTTPYASSSEVSFAPWRDLVPPAPSSVSRRLHYRITVQFDSAGLPPLTPVEIQQNDIDKLRQEYEDAGLPVPAHSRFGFVGVRPDRFEVSLLYQGDQYLRPQQAHRHRPTAPARASQCTDAPFRGPAAPGRP